MRKASYYIYTYNPIAVYSVDGKANLHIDFEYLILIHFRLVLMISNGFVSFQINMSKNPIDKS